MNIYNGNNCIFFIFLISNKVLVMKPAQTLNVLEISVNWPKLIRGLQNIQPNTQTDTHPNNNKTLKTRKGPCISHHLHRRGNEIKHKTK